MQQAQSNFEKCIEIARSLKASRMQLECLLCMAYISFNRGDWYTAQHYFDQAYLVAKECSEPNIAEQCLCNSGIASGNGAMEERQKMLQTFYKSGRNEYQGGAGYNGVGIHDESWSDEEGEGIDIEAT